MLLVMAAGVFRLLPYCYDVVHVRRRGVRENGRTVNVACLAGVGVNGDGRREIPGLDVVADEAGAGWLAFLRSLGARGPKASSWYLRRAPGLKDAIASVLRGAAWQRCRTHFIRNLLTKVPKAAHGLVATFVRTTFAQPDAESVRAQHARTVEQLQPRFQPQRRCSPTPRRSSPSPRFRKSIGGDLE